jgi:hypothetical protein
VSADLTILCVTKAEDYALPFLAHFVSVAHEVGAESLTCVDGSAGFNYGRVHRVKSRGFIESVLEECVVECKTKYILRLDDDEKCSPALVRWLKEGKYRQQAHWKFPRVHLWGDDRHFIAVAPLWPDHQTRLSLREQSGGRNTVHAGSPFGGGTLCDHPIEHHKFLVKTYDERKAIAERYDQIQQGAGTGGMVLFNLPEVAFGGKVPTTPYVDSDRADRALEVANGLGMHQHPEEIREFARWLLTRPLKNVLEIGTLKGGTAALWHELCTGRVVSIDLPDGRFGGKDHGYTWEGARRRNQHLESRFPRFHGLLGDSHNPAAFEQVSSFMGKERFDFLFIDGDHTYDGVKQDYMMYRELVHPGGIIAFHDILDTPFHRAAGCLVSDFWKQLPPHKAEIVNGNGQWGGIGVTFR